MSNLTLSAPTPLSSGGRSERATLDPNRASATTWIAVLAAMIGSFMAILNIQITNASLLNIEGGIGTGVDNGSWISTSYLIGEIVVIPLTDYLSRVFSFRRYMLASAALFAVFSVACAFTHDLPSMIAMRGLQGFAGGVLIPMAFTLVLTKLPKPQQPIGLAVFALSVTFAPAIGPTIGGYLTENYGWQTIFFVNVLPTIVMVSALYLTLERQPMQLKLLKEGDWAGIATMAVGLSALQTVLEEGNKDDWFSSPFILRLAAVALVSLSLFVWIELTIEKPLIRLRLLKQRNFGLGVIAMTMVGFALFGSVYILPAYLGQAQGYNAEQIGAVLAWTGLPQLVLIPLVPKLMQRFDTRYVAFTGLMIFAYSCFMNTAMSPDYAGDQLWIPNIVRAIGQAMVLTPLTSVMTGGIAPQDAQSRRRHRHRGARHRDHKARAVPLQHHWPVGHAGSRGSTQPDRTNDKLLHQPWRVRCRSGASAGYHRARQSGETPGAGDGLQRHVCGDRSSTGSCRYRRHVHAKGEGNSGWSALARCTSSLVPIIAECRLWSPTWRADRAWASGRHRPGL
jgi:DHA2 family multidrug resistance protein